MAVKNYVLDTNVLLHDARELRADRVERSRIGAAADPGADQRDPLQLPVRFHVELLGGTIRRRRRAPLPEGAHGAAVAELPDGAAYLCFASAVVQPVARWGEDIGPVKAS